MNLIHLANIQPRVRHAFTGWGTMTVGMGLESLRVLGTAGQRQILQQMKHVLASLKANFTENGNDTANVQPCWHVSIDTTTYAHSLIGLSRSFWHQAVPPALLWVHALAPAPPCQVDKFQVWVSAAAQTQKSVLCI